MRDELTTAEAAKIAGIDQSMIRRHIREGRLEGTLITDRMYLIPRSALKKFLAVPRRRGPKNKKT